MTTPTFPTTDSAGSDSGRQSVHEADMGGASMATSSGQFIAGLLAYGQLESVGTPRRLVEGLLPEMDPVVRQEVTDRLLAIGYQAGRLSVRPQFHGEELAKARDLLAQAGFAAMAGQVTRSLNTVAPRSGRGAAVDGESARGH